jgi:hypothetical protein
MLPTPNAPKIHHMNPPEGFTEDEAVGGVVDDASTTGDGVASPLGDGDAVGVPGGLPIAGVGVAWSVVGGTGVGAPVAVTRI